MQSHKLTFQQTGMVALGQFICVCLMLSLYFLFGQLDLQAVFGGICGGALAITNFFFMALGAETAMNKAAKQDAKGGKATIHLSYGARMLALFVVLFLLAKSDLVNIFTAAAPLVFTRPILTVTELLRKQGEEKA